jgi:two-component system cell cycle response regulator
MKKIIHVENSDFFRKVVKTFLSEQGFWVESFNHGATALAALDTGEVGLIITGLSFPDMEGVEFIKRAAGHSACIPVIVLTSTQDPETDRLLHELGIKARVLKLGNWKAEIIPLIDRYFISN